MSVAQGFMASQRAQASPQSPQWNVVNPVTSGMILPTGNPNFNDIYPGTQDFCWECWIKPGEWYNQPALLMGWNVFTLPPNAAGLACGIYPDTNNDASGVLSFEFSNGAAGVSDQISTLPSSFWNTWFHVAWSRIGTTFKLWANGELMAQKTGITTNYDIAWSGASTPPFFFTGAVGDRDETYGNALGGQWRNMRLTFGNSVYGDVSTITPPPFEVDIQPVTGTEFIWWPSADSEMGQAYRTGVGDASPDYSSSNNWYFNMYNGATTNVLPDAMLYAYPSGQQIVPFTDSDANGPAGTWTNEGTVPDQPVITTGGPPPMFGTSIGDFTATGTDVRISSSDTALGNFYGQFMIGIWFYMPADITNECKNIISVEVTDGMVINIGRPGQGIDWLSIYAYGGTERAYGQHIWARNAWNYVYIQRPFFGTGDIISAWAAANGDNYATNLNLTMTAGAADLQFAAGGLTSIGCQTGSSVSSQMYFNQIFGFEYGFNGTNLYLYPYDQPTIPVIYVPPKDYGWLTTYFDFQGTNGSTNIQPVAPI